MPRLDRLLTGLPAQKIILGCAVTKYKRSPHSRRDSSSFAPQVLQQCKSGRETMRELSRLPTAIPTFDGRLRKNVHARSRKTRVWSRCLTVSFVLRDAV
jgi:hypothetical protein